MSNTKWIYGWAWPAAALLALSFAVLVTTKRARRIDYVSRVAGSPAAASASHPVEVRAPESRPRLVIPGHHNESFEWLGLTRQMLARREWRVRHIDYENAPGGVEVYSTSPYRWWLGLVALLCHGVTRSPLVPSLEWAATYADPLLLLVFGAATVLFAARRFGALAAALAAAALATLFPLAAGFLPGVPDDLGLAQACAVWSLLPLLAGAALEDGPDVARRTRPWFVAAGIAGGVGMWVSVSRQLPLLVGVGLGALLAAWIARGPTGGARRPLPWRAWGLAGAATCLLAYIVEYFPAHMGTWELRVIHPIFGLVWLGAADLLARTTAWLGGDRPKWTFRSAAGWVLSAAALASLPVAMRVGHTLAFLSGDLPTMSLSLMPGGETAPTFWAWLLQNGFTRTVWATVLPLLILIPAALLLLPGMASQARRIPIALAMGPVMVATAFAFRQISWWNGVDATVIVLLVACAAALRDGPRPRLVAGVAAALSALIFIPGAFKQWPASETLNKDGLTDSEAIGLVERDLAYLLANHVGTDGAVVLAPPAMTSSLYYYGGLRGLATFGWQDNDGFRSAVRIVSASTPEEAQELIGLHGVTHILIPTWDPFMDAFAQIGAGQVGGTFLGRLHQWNLPPWLRPIPYLVPSIAGFEGQSVTILEVVDDQDDATALSRIAVDLTDTGQFDLASKAGAALRRFPADLGALVARAQVEEGCHEDEEFAASADLLVRRIAGGADRDLPWDQRVGLAVVLVQAHHIDLARPRLQACIAGVTEKELRSLSTILLYRFQVLRKALNLEIPDPYLRALSLQLLPPDLRARVE